MATLDQMIGYSDAVRAVLQEVQILKGAVEDLGSDPMGVLSAIDLDSILATPVAKKLPVLSQTPAQAQVSVKPLSEPLRLPDVDLPKPRSKSLLDDAREALKKLNEKTKQEIEDKGEVEPVVMAEPEPEPEVQEPISGRRPTSDPNTSYEMRGPKVKQRNIAEILPSGVAITKPTKQALEFLYSYLQENGPTPRPVVVEAAKSKGISEWALKEARRYADDIKVKIIGLRGMHYLYLDGQEDRLPDANGDAKQIKASVESGRGLNPDEVNVLMHTPASVAELIGRTGLHPQKVKNSLEFLQRTKRVMLDKGANVWRPVEVAKA